MSGSDVGAAAEATARIELGSFNPSLELTVIGGDFRPVASGVGRLVANVPPGIYQIVIRAGPVVERRLVSLRSGETHTETELHLAFPSAAPVQGTSTTHEYHQELAVEASRKAHAAAGFESWLVVIVRDVRGADGPPLDPAVLRRLELLDRGMHPVAGFADGWDVRQRDAAAAWSGGLASGPYILRTDVAGGADGRVDQSIWLPPGWQTFVFLTIGPAGPEPASASVHLVEMALEWSPYEEGVGLALELASWALREGRAVVPTDLLDILLNSKFRNPMLGLIGAHALLLRPGVDQALLDQVVANLGALVPGHPDLAALRWVAEERRAATTGGNALPRPAGAAAVDWPPMLIASYQALIRMDARDPGAIRDGSIAELIAGDVTVQGIWTAWRPIAAAPEAAPPAPTSAPSAALEEGAAPVSGPPGRVWQPELEAEEILPALAPSVEQLARRRYRDPATGRVARYLANVAELEGPRWAGARFAEITTAELALATQLPSGTVDRSLRELRLLAVTEVSPTTDGKGPFENGAGGAGPGGGGTPGGFRLPLAFFAAIALLLGGVLGVAWGLGAFDGGGFGTASPSPTAGPTVTPEPTPTPTPERTPKPVAVPKVVPGELVFGDVVIGFDDRQPIAIHNDGDAPLLIRSISPSSKDFALSGDCKRVQPRHSCSLDIVFAPTSVGEREAVLAIEAVGFDPIEVPLHGSGAAEGRLDVSPAALDFGFSPPPRGYGVSIVGGGLVRIVDIALGGDSPSSYRIDDLSPCETALAKGDDCFVPIDYIGGDSCYSSYSAEMVITTAGGASYSAALSRTIIC